MVAVASGITTPATAHFCSTPLQVPIGRPVTFTVGVPAEDETVTRVDIEIPDGFELHRGVEFAGWKAERDGDVLRFTGGRIRLLMCAFFTLAGEVAEPAVLVVPFTTYGENGTKLREFRSEELNHVDAAQLVYAGMDPAALSDDLDSGFNQALAIAGWVLMGLAAGGALILFVRRRRG